MIKTFSIFIAFFIALSSPTFAAGKRAGKGKRAQHGLALRQIDKNSNHQIDGDEIAVLKEKFAKAPADGRIKKRLDRNTNGQLDDDELAALNKQLTKRAAKKAGGGQAKKGKKAAGRKPGAKAKKKSAQ
jgi:hypothetical protein